MKPITNDSEHRVDLANWLKHILGKMVMVIAAFQLLIFLSTNWNYSSCDSCHFKNYFWSLQRYRRLYNKSLPTVLVAEKHIHLLNGIVRTVKIRMSQRLLSSIWENCTRRQEIWSRYVISSQRPSELSPTVLSQCNTFFCIELAMTKIRSKFIKWYRQFARITPWIAFIAISTCNTMGWASELPVLVKMKNLTKEHNPILMTLISGMFGQERMLMEIGRENGQLGSCCKGMATKLTEVGCENGRADRNWRNFMQSSTWYCVPSTISPMIIGVAVMQHLIIKIKQ